MTEEEYKRWLQWRYRQMSFLGQVIYLCRLLLARRRGYHAVWDFVRQDARSIDKPIAMNYNGLQRRAAR